MVFLWNESLLVGSKNALNLSGQSCTEWDLDKLMNSIQAIHVQRSRPKVQRNQRGEGKSDPYFRIPLENNSWVTISIL